jgi:hypothetical protein
MFIGGADARYLGTALMKNGREKTSTYLMKRWNSHPRILLFREDYEKERNPIPQLIHRTRQKCSSLVELMWHGRMCLLELEDEGALRKTNFKARLSSPEPRVQR